MFKQSRMKKLLRRQSKQIKNFMHLVLKSNPEDARI